MGLLYHTVVLFLVFWGTSILFSIMAAPIYIPTNSEGASLFSTPSRAFVICRFFFLNDGHSNWFKMVPHCSFDFLFSNYAYHSLDHYFGHSRDFIWWYGDQTFHSVQNFCGCINCRIKWTINKKHLARFMPHGVESHGCSMIREDAALRDKTNVISVWKIFGTKISTHKSAKHMK